MNKYVWNNKFITHDDPQINYELSHYHIKFLNEKEPLIATMDILSLWNHPGHNIYVLRWSNDSVTQHTKDIFDKLVGLVLIPYNQWDRDNKLNQLFLNDTN